MERLIGIPVSPGVAWGPAVLLLQHPLAVRYAIAGAHVPREIARLNRARELAFEQISEIRTRVAAHAGADLAQLFEAQLLMLDDRMLVPRAREIIAGERVNTEWALQRAFDEICAIFQGADDAYLRERRGDVADVVGRLRRNLHAASGRHPDLFRELAPGSILLADDLPPSLAGQLDRSPVVGLGTDTGSRTHHSAILARSLGLPAVAGLGRATARVLPGTLVLIDGTGGELVVEPSAELIEALRSRRAAAAERAASVPVGTVAPLATSDGVAIRLEANVELPSEADVARAAGAEGVGLFRTEFVMGGQALAAFAEDEQYAAYRDLVERMAPWPVTIRTFDLDESQAGGPAFGAVLPEPGYEPESRGPLGLRGVRLSLHRPDSFLVQLRAIVRAARHGTVRVLLPFVTSAAEVREARVLLQAARAAVTAEDGQDPDIPLGIMIEVPSAALTADLLAEDADFFSIGTNDLVQYCLAADRSDGRMARMYEPTHPAVLRAIRMVVRAARHRRRPVAVCGEMAGDPASLVLLLGLGVTAFSMNPASMPAARRAIGATSVRDARRLARSAMNLGTGRDASRSPDATPFTNE